MKSIRSINITLKYWYIFSVNNFICIRRFSGRDRQETNILVIILFVFIDYHVGIDRKQTYCRHNVRTVSTIHSFSRYIYVCVCVCVWNHRSVLSCYHNSVPPSISFSWFLLFHVFRDEKSGFMNTLENRLWIFLFHFCSKAKNSKFLAESTYSSILESKVRSINTWVRQRHGHIQRGRGNSWTTLAAFIDWLCNIHKTVRI